ncbi:hypothetical protein E1287_37135 [Actinomadura sp. KC06]|uniref:hypothetical protein n=1 Tax=Actinomadura sp. KC06 TaxID=2530369 RepID=UPI001046E592|nr:hypothetical protein [Actinomadura sp. KC06]TDD25586.1 hypothetical protein E1287_37135 [Actinomadura sp. KC06]
MATWPPRDMDPFAMAPWLRSSRTISSTWFWVFVPLLSIAVILVALAEDSLGDPSDVQIIQDLGRFFGLKIKSASSPKFPLLRDFASVFIMFLFVATSVLLHRQWKHMAELLTELAANNAIKPRNTIRLSRRSELLGVDRIIRNVRPEEAVDALVARMNRIFQGVAGRWSLVILGTSLAMTAAIMLGGRLDGVFRPSCRRG